MHHLSEVHLKMVPLASNANRLADPANQQYIRNSLSEFVEVASRVAKDENKPDADPLIGYTAGMLAADTRQALVAFEAGDYPGVRYSLNRVSSSCISCHTRADRGAKDYGLAWEPNLQKFTPLQYIDFLLANRQYARALSAAKTMAKDQEAAQLDARSWLMGIQRVLAMVVRVNESPTKAIELVNLVIANKGAPFYSRMDAMEWKKDLEAWAKEGKAMSNAERHRRIVRLVKQAESHGPQGARAALILNLRASGMLHHFLENPNTPKYGEYLYYAGLVAESLRDLQLGSLDQYYFETCIRVSPHTRLASECYASLERSVYQANPYLELEPTTNWAIQARLVELKKLSDPNIEPSEPLWKQRQMDRALPEPGF